MLQPADRSSLPRSLSLSAHTPLDRLLTSRTLMHGRVSNLGEVIDCGGGAQCYLIIIPVTMSRTQTEFVWA